MLPHERSGGKRHINSIEWGNGYVEGWCLSPMSHHVIGSAWHHSFPPYSLGYLAELHGGSSHNSAKLLDKLHELVSMPSNFAAGMAFLYSLLILLGSYGREIHEMTGNIAFGYLFIP